MAKILKTNASEVISKLYLNDELADVHFIPAKIILENKIFISGMDPRTTVEDIETHFGEVGSIKKERRRLYEPSIWIYLNKETGESKGEATVEYNDSNAAKSAISKFDSTNFKGAKISVSIAYRKITPENYKLIYDHSEKEENMNIKNNMIFVDGMNPDTTEKHIEEWFGEVGDIQIIKETKKPNIYLYPAKSENSKRKASIEYNHPNAAKLAVDKLHNKVFRGYAILVTYYLKSRNNDNDADINWNNNVPKIPANKAILAALSPVFRNMFFGASKEVDDVKIIDADVESFKEFLQFFYLNEVTISMENIETIIRLANEYDIIEYVKSCTFPCGELTLDNICLSYRLALYLKDESLMKLCDAEISKCDKDTLKTILGMRLKIGENGIVEGKHFFSDFRFF